MDNSTIIEIGDLFQKSISNLKKRKTLLLLQVQEFQKLQDAIKSNDESFQDGVMVFLGQGYWVSKSQDEALQYLDRRILGTNDAIDKINDNLSVGANALNEMERLSQLNPQEIDENPRINEEGLPFIDIQEELDEGGNIIAVKLNDDAAPAADISEKNAQVRGIIENSYITEDLSIDLTEDPSIEITASMSNKKAIRNKSIGSCRDKDAEIFQLLEDMEIVDTSTKLELLEQEALKKIESTNITDDEKRMLRDVISLVVPERDDSQQVGSFIQSRVSDVSNLEEASLRKVTRIENNDVYELEVIAREVDEEDSFNAHQDESEEFSYNFEDSDFSQEDEDDLDDDYADEILYGGRASLLPRAIDAQNGLWSDIQNLRATKFGTQKEKESTKKKSVSFSENIEIKEVENVSECLRNIEHRKQNVLRFKESRILSGASSLLKVSPMPLILEQNQRDEVTADIFERNDPWSIQESTKIESGLPIQGEEDGDPVFAELQNQLMKDREKSRMSTFRQMLVQNPLQRAALNQTHHSKTVISPIEIADQEQEIIQKENTISQIEQIPEQELPEPAFEIEVPSTTLVEFKEVKQLNNNHFNDDMDSMVQAYNAGMFDEDVHSSGPVIDKLEDFEVLNRIINSMTPEERALTHNVEGKSDEFDSSLNEVGSYSDSEDDGEILMDHIVEKDFSDTDDEDADRIQESILGQEIEDNYYKLREKINSRKKETSSKEFEPLNETPRVSRFMAGRQKSS